MRRTILLIAALAMASIMVHGQQNTNRLLIEKDGVEWLRVDGQGKYHYAPDFNAERIVNEMAALGAKVLPSTCSAQGTAICFRYGLVISLSTGQNSPWFDSTKPKKYAHSQQQDPKPIVGKPAPEMEIVAAPVESANEIKEALQAQEAAWRAYVTAQKDIQIAVLRALTRLKIDADECKRQTPNGINALGCWKVDQQTGASSFEKQKVKK